MKIFDLLYLAK